MVDMDLLKRTIEKSGMTVVAVAKKSGILRETLYNRLGGVGEFKASEITGLSNALNLTGAERDAIFFAQEGELNSTRKADAPLDYLFATAEQEVG